MNASFVRSAGGKNWSISKTPSLRIGGDWISPIRAPRSRSRPARHAFSIRFESSTCSRLESGSAWIPTSASRLVTVPSISSRSASASVSHESVGRAERADDVERDAGRRAGRVDRDVRRVLQGLQALGADAVRREPLAPDRRLLLRVRRRAERPAACASASLTQGRKLAGGEVGEDERQVRHVALRIEDERRDPRQEGLLEQDDGEAGLAGAGHAHDDAVRRQVARADDDLVGARLPGRRVDLVADVEGAPVGHRPRV